MSMDPWCITLGLHLVRRYAFVCFLTTQAQRNAADVNPPVLCSLRPHFRCSDLLTTGTPEPTTPVAGHLTLVRYGDDQQLITIVCVNKPERKSRKQHTSSTVDERRPVFSKGGNPARRTLEFGEEIGSETRLRLLVVGNGRQHLRLRGSKESEASHLNSARAFAKTSSEGMLRSSPAR
jgi:hypothetical protein